MPSHFGELALILLIAAAVGAVGVALRQPLIVSFIAVGVLVGPAALDVVTMGAEFELLATIGISILLFVVGLKLDLEVIRTMGPVALATGLGQVLFTSIVGYILCVAMGMAWLPALYVAVALTFSSTIIIVKLLSDKREIDSLHGRIAVGFLIVQDLVVVLVMIGLSALRAAEGGEDVSLLRAAFLVVVKAGGFLAIVALLARFVLPRLVALLARNRELLVLFAIAWAAALAEAGHAMGLSREVGAFLAGVSLASSPFRESISGRLVTIRDFLLLFFFIDLGARLDLGLLGAELGRATVLSLFVLVGNPLIVMAIMGVMGYRRRTGFLAGLTVAQISEFSLILAALGLTLGHIDRETMGLVTLVGLVTIGLSTYLILYSHPIYERIAPLLAVFERRDPVRERASEPVGGDAGAEIVLFGLGRYGSSIAHALRDAGVRVRGVDFDPTMVAAWRRQGFDARYGDASDPEFLAHVAEARPAWVVCTVPDLDVSRTLVRALREDGFAGGVAATAHAHADAERLRQAGFDLVMLPFVDAAERAAATLREAIDRRSSAS
jgi:Kef-type K+ transport system membrane component KefB